MTASPQVRIVVAEPRTSVGAAPRGSARALGRLGTEVSVERARGADACRRCLAAGDVDLVILEPGLGADAEALLAELRDSGPPVVVVSPGPTAEAALDAFRQGAADCVVAGVQFDQVLPVVALEHVRRWRARRERDAARRLERRVETLERYNENIIQNMNSALLVVDREGRIAFGNPMAERILGAVPDGLRDRCVWDWFPDADRDQLQLAHTLRDGTRFRGAETLITRPDGRVVPIGISCAPFSDRDGRSRGAVAIFQDLTEIKQLQRQVLQTEKLASIGQLAAGVAHEINNPMGFIHANLVQLAEYADELQRVFEQVGALRKAVRGGAPGDLVAAAAALDAVLEEVDADYLLADFGKAVRESLEGSERIRHIVRDLRAFSHQDTGEDVEADLIECLDSTANIAWTMMRHSVVLTKEYRELPPVRCRPLQLKQVFMNLLVNAYQAIEARSEQETLRGEIRLRVEAADGVAVVAVEDNGTGIRPEHLDRIFDPFFTTKQVGVGMGLGLSTSFSIVRGHGGELRVESELGRGSVFRVVLPVDGRVRLPDADVA